MLSKKSQSVKRLSYMDWFIAVAAIILVNTLGNFYYARLDLTKEKRHTLSETSKTLADKLDETCIFKIIPRRRIEFKFPTASKRDPRQGL